MADVTVLGLGAMGRRLALRIAEAGHAVTVWSRSSAAPGTADGLDDHERIVRAPTRRAAAAEADVVISMVTDDSASRSVWLDPSDGVLHALPDGAIAVEASTITKAHAMSLDRHAREAAVDFLEAPVVGSRPQADAGALLVVVGGDAGVLDRAEPVVSAYAGAITHVGDVGAAATAKLTINALFGVQVAAYAEAIGVLAASGVPVGDAADLLGGLPITSPGLQRILGLVAAHDFAPNFPIELVAKDFRYFGQLAEHAGASVPVSRAAGRVYADAISEFGQLDIAGIAEQYLV